MIETGEIRKLFAGPPEVTATLVHQARVLLGIVKNGMAFNQLSQGERRITIPIDQRLLEYTDAGNRRWSVRAVGRATISASSRHGQDTIAIDATAVTTTIIPRPQPRVLVPPFFRVLTKSVNFPDVLTVIAAWEPYSATEDTEAVSRREWIKQGIPYLESNWFDEDNNFQNADHYKIWWEFSDLGEDWTATYFVSPHTTAGLYAADYKAYPDHFEREYEEDGFIRYIVFDPEDPEKTSSQPDIHQPPHAVGGFPHQVRGRALGGWYVIKVLVDGQKTVRVEIGKPVEKFDFTLEPNEGLTADDALDDVFPDGSNAGTHTRIWWQGALLINPMDGVIAIVKDGPFLPHWGFTDSVLGPPDLSQAEFHYHSLAQQNLVNQQ